jgi:hypothetical protein
MQMGQKTTTDKSRGEMFECARGFLGIAKELSNASGVCIGLEGNVAHLIAQYSGEDRAILIRELQHLDILNQLLVALSSYASVLGSQCISDTAIDVDGASRELGLSRVAARLREIERVSSTSSGDHGPGCGDMDLL